MIPQLVITADGRSQNTQPISMRVLPPQENSDFKFRLSLSESRAYVGQQLTLTAEWFIGRAVQEFSFTVPLLEDERFEIVEPPAPPAGTGPDSSDLMEIALGDRRTIAQKGTGVLDGRQFTVLRFRKLMVPKTEGAVRIPAATVTFSTPFELPSRRRGLFDDFLGDGLFTDMFGGFRDTETLAIPSNRPRLEVLSLPAGRRPRGFNGWIGQFEVSAEASPVAVKVGEPITLSLRVRGTGMRVTARLPALDEQPSLARDFNVPREIGAGEDRDGARFFTQTLRARREGIAAIPPIELPYFDPDLGEYRVAHTAPIPIEVEPSRIVTAEDAEGGRPSGPRQLGVETGETGLAHNYVDASALQPMPGLLRVRLRPLGPLPIALALLAMPPLIFGGLQAARLSRRHGGFAFGWRRSPRALWRAATDAIDVEGGPGSAVADAVLAALRRYLGLKLGGKRSEAAAWTFADVAGRVEAVAVRSEAGDDPAGASLLSDLKSVFERCEAASYAGVEPMDLDWRRRLVADASEVVDRIERASR